MHRAHSARIPARLTLLGNHKTESSVSMETVIDCQCDSAPLLSVEEQWHGDAKLELRQIAFRSASDMCRGVLFANYSAGEFLFESLSFHGLAFLFSLFFASNNNFNLGLLLAFRLMLLVWSGVTMTMLIVVLDSCLGFTPLNRPLSTVI